MSVLPVGMGDSGGYQIQRSLRFRSSASAYLSRTFTSQPNTWTLSAWVKRGVLGAGQTIAAARWVSGVANGVYFNANDTIAINLNNTTAHTSTAVFRDPSAHCHIQVAVTQSGLSYLYVNGTQIGSWTSTATSWIFTNAANYVNAIGKNGDQNANYFDGYLSEVNFIDGQALTPSSFGETSATTGQWTAKRYTGTYGTNGFYLPFSDTTSTTTLCYDASGNANHWTPTNISLTAGTTYDSMTDVPLGGGGSLGNGQGNYATLNPLAAPVPASSYLSSANTSLYFANTSAWISVGSTIAVSQGKWYWEVTTSNIASPSDAMIGVANINEVSTYITTNYYVGQGVNAYGYYSANGNKYNGGGGAAYGAAYGNVVIGVTLDMDTGTLTFYVNNVSQGAAFVGITGTITPVVSSKSGISTVNFGQRPFAYTPPTGFKALHTGNLTSDTVTTSGTFTGNVSTDGPFIWCNGTPETLTINGNAVTFGTHADRLANGFKLRTASTSYNASGSNTWTATVLSPSSKSAFRAQNAKGNP